MNIDINKPIQLPSFIKKPLKMGWKMATTVTFWLCICLLYGYILYAAFLYGQFAFHLTNDYCFSPAKVHVWFWLFILAAWLVIWSWKHLPENTFLKYVSYWWSFWLILTALAAFLNEIESSGKYYGITLGNMLFTGGDIVLYLWCMVGIAMMFLPSKIRRYAVALHTFISVTTLTIIVRGNL